MGEGDWVWLSVLSWDQGNWLQKIETLGRVRARGYPFGDGERLLCLVEFFAGNDAREGWFSDYEFWPCEPDEEEVAEWLAKTLAS